MADYQHVTGRFTFKGINLRLPADALPAGYYPFVESIRPYTEDVLAPRPGLSPITNAPLDMTDVHSAIRLTDQTPWAGQPYTRIYGAGTKLYAGAGSAIGGIAEGFSGNPLGLVPIAPNEVPEAWVYVADSNQFVKVDVSGAVYGVGLAAPTQPPNAFLGTPNYQIIDRLDNAATWLNDGTYSADLTTQPRLVTTIGVVRYDSGTTGWGSFSLAAFTPNVQGGMFLIVGGAETCIVDEVKPAIANTTIQSIVYDIGSTGLCTIQPAALGIGQIDPNEVDPLSVGDSTQVASLAVNALIEINAEWVRIQSVTVGPDGSFSFRCATGVTHFAGEPILGTQSIRMFTVGSYGGGTTVTANMVQNELIPGASPPAQMIGGIYKLFQTNLSVVNGRAAQPEDYIHLSVQINNINQLVEGRIYFDVDAFENDFTQNYYLYTFQASDLTPALPSANAPQQQTVADTISDIVAQQQLEQAQQAQGTDTPVTNQDNFTAVHPTQLPSGSTDPTTVVPNQVGAGQSQWFELTFPLSALIRTGTDSSRSLANVQGVKIEITATTSAPVQMLYNALWIGGTYGPDVGLVGAPYIYCYRGRSSLTGAKGNPSPATRSGVTPSRQPVVVELTQHPDPQCDLLDVYRFGGVMDTWRIVGTTENTSNPSFTDLYDDAAAQAGDAIEYDNFQPWVTVDQPKTGYVNVCGTVVTWVSGDPFSQSWQAGNLIEINGVVQQLYGPPSSPTFLQIVANGGNATNVPYVIQAPEVGPTPLPCFWGDFQGFYFSCGDTKNPGRLYWTKQYLPEVTSDVNYLDVTSPDEPLMNGCIWDGRPWVWSTADLYEIQATGNDAQPFVARKTPAGYGLWNRWGFAVRPNSMDWIVSDGIRSSQGEASTSLTDSDLYPIFPHEGQPGQTVNTIAPPNMALTSQLFLSASETYLYFDYVDVNGSFRTLIHDAARGGWMFDAYSKPVNRHVVDEGPGVHDILALGNDGNVYQLGSNLDVVSPIQATVWTPCVNFGDPRIDKQVGDVYLESDAQGGAGFVGIIGYNQYSSFSAHYSGINNGQVGRMPAILDINAGVGQYARDVGLQIIWSTAAGITPVIYLWQPWFLQKVELTSLRATDWDMAGTAGAKFLQGVSLHFDTGGVNKRIQIEGDGGVVLTTLTVNSNGESIQAFSIPTPTVTHLMRIVPLDAQDWHLYEAPQWLFQSAPEAALNWQTQPTTHDLPGWLHLRPFAYIAYEATATCTMAISTELGTVNYALPATAGVLGTYVKAFVPIQVQKGKRFTYQLSSTQPVRLYENDCEIGVGIWGRSDQYRIQRPFGGPSRDRGGARI